jgi:hypothetical protein
MQRWCRYHTTGIIIRLNIYVRFHVDAHYYNSTYNTTYSDASCGRFSRARNYFLFTTNKNLLANRLTWLATKFNKKCMLCSLKYVTIRLQGCMCFIKLSNSLSLTISHCERRPWPLNKSLPNILASMIYFLKETCTFVPDINKQALIFHREWPYHMKTYTVF